MGSGYSPVNQYTLPTWMSGWHLYQGGWIDPIDLAAVTTNGIYTVGTLEDASAHPRVVRIPRPGKSDYLYLEFR